VADTAESQLAAAEELINRAAALLSTAPDVPSGDLLRLAELRIAAGHLHIAITGAERTQRIALEMKSQMAATHSLLDRAAGPGGDL